MTEVGYGTGYWAGAGYRAGAQRLGWGMGLDMGLGTRDWGWEGYGAGYRAGRVVISEITLFCSILVM